MVATVLERVHFDLIGRSYIEQGLGEGSDW